MARRPPARRRIEPARENASRTRRRPAEPTPSSAVRAALSQTTTIPGIAILPLRLFLGLTFLYGGWQKITDPGFFRLGSPTYIGTQLRNFAQGSPIHFLLVHFLEHSQAIGVLTIFTEITIGILVLLGLFTRPAAIVGLVLNLTFFLSASWKVYPYFLGSDIVFVMCWLTLAITGPGAFYLDSLVAGPLRRLLSPGLTPIVLGPPDPERAQVPAEIGHGVAPGSASRAASLLSRGEVLVAGAATVVLVILGLGPRPSFGAGAASGAPASSSATPATAPTAGAQPTSPAGNAAPAPAGKRVGNTSQIGLNSALATTDPKSGDPAVVVHTVGNKFVAYDAVCTHAGCTVQYDPSYKLLVCPCHGGAFDPAQGANVVAGPPPSPLTSLPITIDSKGQYLSRLSRGPSVDIDRSLRLARQALSVLVSCLSLSLFLSQHAPQHLLGR